MKNTIQLFIDNEKKVKGYPITSPDRVIDDNGVSIKKRLQNNVKFDIVGEGEEVPELDGKYDDTEIVERIDRVEKQIRSVSFYFDGKINIEQYSHLVTNDDWTIALQQAVNDCLSQKKYLEIVGKYKISNTIRINNDGVTNAMYFGQKTLGIIGTGAFKSHIYMDDSITDGRPLFTGTDFTSQPNNLARIQVYFKHCSFSRGLKYFRSANDSGCSLFENCRLTASTIDNCGIFALDYIIKNGAFGDSYFTNNVTYDIRTSHIQGIIGDSRISHNMLTGSSQNRSIIFDCENINMSYFTDNWIQWADQIIKCPYFSTTHINNNTFDLCRNPLNLSVMSGSIVGNTFHKCSYYELSKANNYSMTEDEEFVFAKITKLGKNGGCSLIGNNGKSSEQIAIITVDENSEFTSFGNILYEDNNHYKGKQKITIINTSKSLPKKCHFNELNNIFVDRLDDVRLNSFAGQIFNFNGKKLQCSYDKKIVDLDGNMYGYSLNILPTLDSDKWEKSGNLTNITYENNGDKIKCELKEGQINKEITYTISENVSGKYVIFASGIGTNIEINIKATRNDETTFYQPIYDRSRGAGTIIDFTNCKKLIFRLICKNGTGFEFYDLFMAKFSENNYKSIDSSLILSGGKKYKQVLNSVSLETKFVELI